MCWRIGAQQRPTRYHHRPQRDHQPLFPTLRTLHLTKSSSVDYCYSIITQNVTYCEAWDSFVVFSSSNFVQLRSTWIVSSASQKLLIFSGIMSFTLDIYSFNLVWIGLERRNRWEDNGFLGSRFEQREGGILEVGLLFLPESSPMLIISSSSQCIPTAGLVMSLTKPKLRRKVPVPSAYIHVVGVVFFPIHESCKL